MEKIKHPLFMLSGSEVNLRKSFFDLLRIRGKQFFRGGFHPVAKLLYDLVNGNKPLISPIQPFVDILGNQALQLFFVAVIPVFDDLSREQYMGIVALRMGLLSEEMDEPVLSHGQFVYGGRNLSQFSFRADIPEIHGENSGQLLHFTIYRAYIRVKKLSYIPLEQVRIGYENTAHLQVDDKGREKLPHG